MFAFVMQKHVRRIGQKERRRTMETMARAVHPVCKLSRGDSRVELQVESVPEFYDARNLIARVKLIL